MIPFASPKVAAAFDAFPPDARAGLLQLRRGFAVGAACLSDTGACRVNAPAWCAENRGLWDLCALPNNNHQ